MYIEMRTKVTGIDKPIKMNFIVYDSAIEQALLDSPTGAYFGYHTLEEIKESKDNWLYAQIFNDFEYAIQELTSNRLDVLLRTPELILDWMSKLMLTGESVEYLNEVAYDKLKGLGKDDYEGISKFHTIDEVLMFLGYDEVE